MEVPNTQEGHGVWWGWGEQEVVPSLTQNAHYRAASQRKPRQAVVGLPPQVTELGRFPKQWGATEGSAGEQHFRSMALSEACGVTGCGVIQKDRGVRGEREGKTPQQTPAPGVIVPALPRPALPAGKAEPAQCLLPHCPVHQHHRGPAGRDPTAQVQDR